MARSFKNDHLRNLLLYAPSRSAFICLVGLMIFFEAHGRPSDQAIVESQSEKMVSEENLANQEIAETTNEPEKLDPEPLLPPKDHFPTAIGLVSAGQYFSRHAFIADKSRRTLSIWRFTADGPQFIEAHAMDKGKVEGDKHVLGDKKTPEGIYFFTQSYSGSQLDFNEYGSRAFVMDYPNFFDRKNRKTGSGIWLHAVPDSKSLFRGSRGCVVVRDEIVQRLDRFIDLKKTPIIVVEKADYEPLSNYQQFTQEWLNYLARWRSSWESQNISDYIKFYHPEFENLGRGRDQWRVYKEALADKYAFIRVSIIEPMVFIHNDSAVIRFLQDYKSDQNQDFGEKTLYLKKLDEDFKIIGEEWVAAPKIAGNKRPAGVAGLSSDSSEEEF